jgi:hypothetical protein
MNRKKLVTMVALALALVLLAASAMAETYYVKTNNGGSVSIRYQPDSSLAKMAYLGYGTAVNVLYFQGSWACITYDGQTLDGESHYGDAWIPSKYLVSEKPAPYTPSSGGSGSGSSGGGLNALFNMGKQVTPYTVKVRPTRNSGVVNVRWAPSKQCTLLRAYPADTELTVIAELGTDWFQVMDPNDNTIVGFLNKAYIVK